MEEVMDFANICGSAGYCDVILRDWFWAVTIFMPLLVLMVFGIPIVQILRRAGHSGWWAIIAFVPLLNLIGLWVFAFARWPNLDDRPAGHSGGPP
jgi:hypothetical protein